MSADQDRTASLMTPAKLAQLKPGPAASPAAWLDQLASDAGHMHATRLAELSAQLEEQALADKLLALGQQLRSAA